VRMNREPEHCEFREPFTDAGGQAAVACALARRILGTSRQDAARTTERACRQCCGFRLPSPSHLNPVVASLVYPGAKLIAEDRRSSWREREEAVRSRNLAIEQLGLIRLGGRSVGLQGEQKRELESQREPAHATVSRLRWSVGVLTAPRPVPTIDRTLSSLARAGFSPVHIFAEPGSWIPEQFAHLPRTVHGRPLGNLGNFYTSLASLLMLEPGADCYAVFQDDIEVAEGLRAWCDKELWPMGAGLVSLYTCGVDHGRQSGWQILHRGMCH